LRDDAGYAFAADKALADILVPGAPLYGKGAMWAANAGPGDYFSYCNLNWGVLGTLMERITGERFDRLMQRLLLAPLGLHGGFNPSEFSADDLANLATLYRKRSTDTEVWNPAGPWIAQVDDYRDARPSGPAGIATATIGSNATPFSPTGGLRISAHDMGKIMLMLMNDGVHEGRQILRASTLAHMFTRQWSTDGHGANGDTSGGLFNYWGLGNQQFPDQAGSASGLLEDAGFDAVGHLGEAYGLYSVFVVDRARRNGMVVLVGGTGTDPEALKGRYSSLTRLEECILTALYRHAISMHVQII
jgi:CubicO group peptidase (beta-lactamase class C family)